jgi:hypothetical protein
VSPHRLSVVLAAALALAAPVRADLRREVEPNDLGADAQPVAIPASVGGTIGVPGDVDRFAVRLEVGGILKADLLARGFRAGSSEGSQLQAVLTVQDPSGAVVAQDATLGEYDDPSLSFQAGVAGRYVVSVADLSPSAGSPDHLYVLSLEPEPNDTPAGATRILPPVLPSIDALIEPPGDRDFYIVSGAAGQVLTVDIDSAVFNPSSPPAKVVLTVYDASVAPLAQDAYTSVDEEDPYLEVALPATADYLVEVRELRSFVGNTNTFYQMSVDLGPGTDNDTFASASPVDLPRAASGTVAPASDVDHYRFSLAGTGLVADLDARQDLVSLLDGLLALQDAGGVIAADATAPDPQLAVSPGPGDYSVSVEGSCSGGGCLDEDAYYVLYLDGDADADGLRLPVDNCPAAGNPEQADGDGDGVGDVCDVCPLVFDPGQQDADGDGVGDACPCAAPEATVAGLAFVDGTTLDWVLTPGASSYDLYRGSLGALPVYDHACLASAVTGPPAMDPQAPASGGFYYLVAGRTACGGGPLGSGSSGEPRPPASTCP